jgi:hypothetical protein
MPGRVLPRPDGAFGELRAQRSRDIGSNASAVRLTIGKSTVTETDVVETAPAPEPVAPALHVRPSTGMCDVGAKSTGPHFAVDDESCRERLLR